MKYLQYRLRYRTEVRHSRPSDETLLFAALLCFVAGLALQLCGCGEPKTPTRYQARAAVEVTAKAVRVFGESCAAYALQTNDLPLAERCRDAYDAARTSLIVTASGIDAWDRSATSRESLVCALRRSLSHISKEAQYLSSHEVPQFVFDDALSLVQLLGACREVKP